MRIITGSAKGRRLVVPDPDETRPATDRVREAVFSAIGAWVEGARVLDLYAGSGSYGLEALSRGADDATFVERGRSAIDALRRNVAALGIGGTVISSTVDGFLSSPGGNTYHLVFIDPPWDLATDQIDRQLRLVDPILEPDGEVVVSRRAKDRTPSPPESWRVAADRRYGDTRIYRYVKEVEET